MTAFLRQAEERQVPAPATLVLFGASGDLVRRKLMPALYRLCVEGLLPDRLSAIQRRRVLVVGFSLQALTYDRRTHP